MTSTLSPFLPPLSDGENFYSIFPSARRKQGQRDDAVMSGERGATNSHSGD